MEQHILHTTISLWKSLKLLNIIIRTHTHEKLKRSWLLMTRPIALCLCNANCSAKDFLAAYHQYFSWLSMTRRIAHHRCNVNCNLRFSLLAVYGSPIMQPNNVGFLSYRWAFSVRSAIYFSLEQIINIQSLISRFMPWLVNSNWQRKPISGIGQE
jgi:hypothetical protein